MKIAELSITEIRIEMERHAELPAELLAQLRTDGRKGVQQLLKQAEQRIAKQKQLRQQWQDMSRYETQYRLKGKPYIAGIDEVGRGPLAGPVVACAVMLPESFYLPGLNDSKKLSEQNREAFYEKIVQEALAVGIGTVDAARIDAINILEATKEAMSLAINGLSHPVDVCLIDAVRLNTIGIEQMSIMGGDGKSISIAAASVVAKVTRDRLMKTYAKEYPQYGFEKNAGYGTKEHLEALERYGPSPIHRLSFGGVKEL